MSIEIRGDFDWSSVGGEVKAEGSPDPSLPYELRDSEDYATDVDDSEREYKQVVNVRKPRDRQGKVEQSTIDAARRRRRSRQQRMILKFLDQLDISVAPAVEKEVLLRRAAVRSADLFAPAPARQGSQTRPKKSLPEQRSQNQPPNQLQTPPNQLHNRRNSK